jgi:hypothetical protein
MLQVDPVQSYLNLKISLLKAGASGKLKTFFFHDSTIKSQLTRNM